MVGRSQPWHAVALRYEVATPAHGPVRDQLAGLLLVERLELEPSGRLVEPQVAQLTPGRQVGILRAPQRHKGRTGVG